MAINFNATPASICAIILRNGRASFFMHGNSAAGVQAREQLNPVNKLTIKRLGLAIRARGTETRPLFGRRLLPRARIMRLGAAMLYTRSSI